MSLPTSPQESYQQREFHQLRGRGRVSVIPAIPTVLSPSSHLHNAKLRACTMSPQAGSGTFSKFSLLVLCSKAPGLPPPGMYLWAAGTDGCQEEHPSCTFARPSLMGPRPPLHRPLAGALSQSPSLALVARIKRFKMTVSAEADQHMELPKDSQRIPLNSCW